MVVVKASAAGAGTKRLTLAARPPGESTIEVKGSELSPSTVPPRCSPPLSSW